MRKMILFLFFLPVFVFGVDSKWNISLVGLRNKDKTSDYNSVILESLKNSLDQTGKYQCAVYADTGQTLSRYKLTDNGDRTVYFNLSKKTGDDFLISGEYFLEGEKIYVILFAIDSAHQIIKTSKTYVGEIGVDIFDLIDKIAGDFASVLQMALPTPDQATIVTYRKTLKLVSEADKFPRTMYNNIGAEFHIYDFRSPNNANGIQEELEFYYQFHIITGKWMYGLDMNVLSASFPLDGRDTGNNTGPSGINIRALLGVGYRLLPKWFLSLHVGIFALAGENSGPGFVFIPGMTYLPSPNWKWDFYLNPYFVLEGNRFGYLSLDPLVISGTYYFNPNLGINFHLGLVYINYDHDVIYSRGGYLGLGLSYRLAIDN